MKPNTKKLAYASLFSAFVCIATLIIKIPSPLKGYVNLGDAVVLIIGWILSGAYGFLAAGIGSALADLILGYTIYIPATFIIKGLMAVTACILYKKLVKFRSPFTARIISGLVSEIIMIAGYYVFEGFLYGFYESLVNIPANAVQGIFGIAIGISLIKFFEKNIKL